LYIKGSQKTLKISAGKHFISSSWTLDFVVVLSDKTNLFSKPVFLLLLVLSKHCNEGDASIATFIYPDFFNLLF